MRSIRFSSTHATAALRSTLDLTRGALAVIGDCLRRYLRPDIASLLLAAVFLIAFVPIIPRATDNARALNCCINDEAPLTQIVDGMNQSPYGEPANFLRAGTNGKFLPERWKDFDYASGFITYYGGLYLAAGFTLLEPLRLLGFDTFPAAPIILRSLSTLFGFLGVMLTYGFGREHIGRTAGVLAALVLATDRYFVHYSVIVHPDTMQFALGMICLCVAVRHTEIDRKESLVAMGILAGLVQGAKMGGPWLVPLVVLAIAVPVFRAQAAAYGATAKERARAVVGRGLLVAGAAVAVYLITTPYLVLSREFMKGALSIMRIVNRSSITSISFFDWARDLWTSFGVPLMVLAAVGLLLTLVDALRGRRVLPLMFALVLGVTQFLFFAKNGKLWVELGYLMNLFVALGLFFGLAVQRGLGLVARIPFGGRGVAAALTAVALVLTLFGRWGAGIDLLMHYRLSRNTTLFQINDWAVASGLPRDARIMWDSAAYFDPAVFPNARFLGDVFTYNHLYQFKPDYIVLTEAIFGARHYQQLIETQTFTRQNEGPHSVRLYQDLLKAKDYGPTAVPGIDYVRRFALSEKSSIGCPAGLDFNPLPTPVIPVSWRIGLMDGIKAVLGTGAVGTWLVQQVGGQSSLIDHTGRQIAAALGRICLVGGAELRLYRIHEPGTPDGFEQPFASSSDGLRRAMDAFDGNAKTAWRPSRTDLSGPYLGFDFGAGSARRMTQLRIEWEEPGRAARGIALETSDDGKTWQAAGRFDAAVTQTAAGTVSIQDLPKDIGAKRYWRVQLSSIPAAPAIGVRELRLIEEGRP